MALSDWDTLALNENNENCGGVFHSEAGAEIELYKNWLYVRSEAMWQEGCGFQKPTIAAINSGDLQLGHLHIIAIRGPKDGIYFCVSESHYPKPDRFMVGIGACGWDMRAFEEREELHWLGIEQSEIDFLKKWLAQVDTPETAASLDWGLAQRFNQGDQFFAGAFGISVPQSEVGKSDNPLIEDVIKGLKTQDLTDEGLAL